MGSLEAGKWKHLAVIAVIVLAVVIALYQLA